MIGSVALVTLGVGGFAGAALSYRRTARREAATRRSLLADCAGLLDAPTLSLDDAGYGVLRGRFEGVEAALRPFADSLAFKRLPQLWLAVTVGVETGTATLDVLRRPTGADAFPAGGRAFRVPVEWPADTRVQGSGDAGPTLARLAPAIAALLADDATKHVLVAPRGVRLVRRIAEADRRAYLIFRDGRFDTARVTPDAAEAAIRAAIGVARAAADHGSLHAHAA